MTERRVAPGQSVQMGAQGQPYAIPMPGSADQPSHQIAQQLGINHQHAVEMAQAVGGRNWGNVLSFLMLLLQGLQNSGLLNPGGGGGGGGVNPIPPITGGTPEFQTHTGNPPQPHSKEQSLPKEAQAQQPTQGGGQGRASKQNNPTQKGDG